MVDLQREEQSQAEKSSNYDLHRVVNDYVNKNAVHVRNKASRGSMDMMISMTL